MIIRRSSRLAHKGVPRKKTKNEKDDGRTSFHTDLRVMESDRLSEYMRDLKNFNLRLLISLLRKDDSMTVHVNLSNEECSRSSFLSCSFLLTDKEKAS